MAADPVVETRPLGFPWETLDPFLFCVHHDDAYPAGNDALGPATSLAGREIGQDFAGKDGWRMYHGQIVPGFPSHPHRGFETITVVRRGLVDHSDSLGATARYGGGDVQWLTAGKGIVHAEMFPLVDPGKPNPLELFQIWLNLPAKSKMAEPHFAMFWNQSVPRSRVLDAKGRATEITVVAGRLGDVAPPAPPPASWAAAAESGVAVWTIRMDPGAEWTLPAAKKGTNRVLYFFAGEGLSVAGKKIEPRNSVSLRAEAVVALTARGTQPVELLLLQGRPIGEPIAQYGPFVMNTREEIMQAVRDYQATQFGGWPWKSDDPVHARDAGRFAKRPDGTLEKGT